MPRRISVKNLKTQLKKIIGAQRASYLKDNLSPIIFNIINSAHKMSLNEIGKFYGTDKTDKHHTFNDLTYLDIYQKYFDVKRNLPINILEIGVRNAASLRTWKAYFPRGQVFGIDIDPGCKKYEENRINIEIGSQDDHAFLKRAFGPKCKFDIIIDDGSHINRHIINSFDYLFYNRLNAGGIYVTEDLACSYEKLQSKYNIMQSWPGMKYNDQDQDYNNERQDLDLFFKQIIYNLDHLKGEVLTMHFWPMICFILKI